MSQSLLSVKPVPRALFTDEQSPSSETTARSSSVISNTSLLTGEFSLIERLIERVSKEK